MKMTRTELQHEAEFYAALHIAKELLSKGIITDEEYNIICTKLKAVFPTIIGELLIP